MGTPTEHQPGNGPAKKLRIQSTHSAEERGLDPYFTCPEATLSLLHLERKFLPHRLWDPGCGDGAITNVLQAHGFSTYASDIEDYGLKGCVIEDFFTTPAPPGVEGIVTNPPFRLAQRFIEKALHEVGYAAFLLRSNFLVEGERRDKFLESHPPVRVYYSSQRFPMMHRYGWTGKRSTSNTPYAWAIWDRRAHHIELPRRFRWKEIVRDNMPSALLESGV